MRPSSHTKHIEDPLVRSGRFYYLLTDLEGNIVRVNPLFEEQFSHSAMDFCGKKASGIFLAESGDKFKQAMQECLQRPETGVQVDLQILLLGGIVQSGRWELIVCRNEEGSATAIQAIGFSLDEPGFFINGKDHHIGEVAE